VTAMAPPLALPPALQLVGQLAMEHTSHVKWLHGRFPGCDGALLEDALQTAYAEALHQLRAASDRRPEFASYDAARGWLRTIAANTAKRTLRGAGETPLPDDDGWDAGTTPAADSELLDRVEREQVHDGLARALADLSDEHARFLRWRYVENLPPASIMALEGFSTLGQYDGRHRRALAALRTALVRLQPDTGCAKARVLLVRHPDAFLGAKRAAAHVVACVPCQAFQRRLRGALAAMPLSPLGLRALSDAVRRHPGELGGDAAADAPRPTPEPAGNALPAHAARIPAGIAKAATAMAGAALVVGGLVMGAGDGGERRGDPRAAPAAEVASPTPTAQPRGTLRWSDNGRRSTFERP
jgi:DNA-directed RNA polymerase specialized sigma24 family protein